ncbi:MAG: toll/interleukin-1 receptor domain-containing protein [Prevotella sp.]|nr:toll/interleukin-1 receptor domain-containing protein [Prevotella sp.]
MEQTTYDVFISYSRKDYVDEKKNVIPGNEVYKIKEALTRAGITYWFDEEGIYSGQNFVEKIVTNIENAKIFLFLSTANSNESSWTCKEIASADEFKKHIIPVRIDSSPYNKKVLFRIADLDYIEYFSNPEKGMKNLIESIKTYLEELAAKEKRKQEEETRRRDVEREKEEERKRLKEQEEKRKQEEQERLVSEIKLTCITLNNEEAKIEIEREKLLKKVDRLDNKEQQEGLIEIINKSGVVYLKIQKEYDAIIERLTKECEEYRQLIQSQENKLGVLRKEIAQQVEFNKVAYKPTETDLRKWNWGAFFLSWVWCIRNRFKWQWIVICFVLWLFPLCNIISSFLLGYWGTKYAWQKGKWKNWEHFQIVQREWMLSLCGFIIYLTVYISIMVLLFKN